MLNKDVSKKIAIVSLLIFGIFILLFIFFSALAQNSVINGEIHSTVLQALLSFISFLPLFVSLFFWGQVFKHKYGHWQTAYKILTFISIAMFLFGLVQILLSILGAYN